MDGLWASPVGGNVQPDHLFWQVFFSTFFERFTGRLVAPVNGFTEGMGIVGIVGQALRLPSLATKMVALQRFVHFCRLL
jgi:hypothetical protein